MDIIQNTETELKLEDMSIEDAQAFFEMLAQKDQTVTSDDSEPTDSELI